MLCFLGIKTHNLLAWTASEHAGITSCLVSSDQIVHENKLYLKLKKCKFEKTRIEYLGLIIPENSVEVDPMKRNLMV